MWHPGMWFGGPLLALLWIGLIAVGLWLLLRNLRERDRGGRARDILDERYARGEINSEEYRERLEHLG